MPHLVQMDKRYSKKGLKIIAAERQNSSTDQVKKLAKKHDVEYTITNGGNGPIPTRGIPHAFVFDVNGNVIFNGHPGDDDFERTIKKALKDVEDTESESTSTSGPLIAKRTWTNNEGKQIKADLLAVVGDKAKLRLVNSKIVLYDIAKLSEDDQAEIKKHAPASSE